MKFFVSMELPFCGHDERLLIEAENILEAEVLADQEAYEWAHCYFDVIDPDYEDELDTGFEWGVDYVFAYDISYHVEPYIPEKHDMYL